MRIQLTKSGVDAIFNSMATGIKFEVSYFKIGRSVLPLAGEDYSDVVDQVWPTPGKPLDIPDIISRVRYYYNDASGDQATFEITLDDTIGDTREENDASNVNFLIGNIGLFYHNPLDGTDYSNDKMLAIASNEIAYHKYRKTSTNEASDIYRDYLTLTFSNITDIIQVVSDIKLDYSNLAMVETVDDLPNANSAQYNIYGINNNFGISNLAVKRVDYTAGKAVWDLYTPPSSITVPSTSFAENVGVGTAVCYKDGKFDVCDGANPNYPYVGIRTDESTIVNTGLYVTSQYLTVGRIYYVNSEGGFTDVPTLYGVGVAVAYDTMVLFFGDTSIPKRIEDLRNTPTILLGDSKRFKIVNINVYIPGGNYEAGDATINGVPVQLEVDDAGAITAITGWPTQVYTSDYAGTYKVEQFDNQTGSATIVTSYANGDTPITGTLQYTHAEDPVVQQSYLRMFREELYQLTEMLLNDFDNVKTGRFIYNVQEGCANSPDPDNFQPGMYLTETIEASNGQKLCSIRNFTNPRFAWYRPYANDAWGDWSFTYGDYYPF